MTTTSTTSTSTPSEDRVHQVMREGLLEQTPLKMGVGVVIGGLASIVLARGGGASRKAITAFGAGIGLGSAWTRTSIDLEGLLSSGETEK